MKYQQQKKLYLYPATFIILLGFALRTGYMRQSHPYVDEYFTILAAEMVQQHGLPWLPSGLFYSHGLLYTYVVAILGGLVKATGSSADISAIEMIYRLPNLFIGLGTMTGLFYATNRWFGAQAALVAVALLAVYPHGIVWGARVRMYTLVFLLAPLLIYTFYRAVEWPQDKRRYILALILLAIAVLIHNWFVALMPWLTIGTAIVGWGFGTVKLQSWRWWLPGLVIIAILAGISSRLESLWLTQPEALSQDTGWRGVIAASMGRLDLITSLTQNVNFLREFVWDNPFNLPVLVMTLLGSFGLWFLYHRSRQQTGLASYFWPMLYLYIIFGGIIATFLFLLKPDLKQPTYAAPVLVLAFIILAGWLQLGLRRLSTAPIRSFFYSFTLILVLLGIFGGLAVLQLPKIFYEGLPPVGYDTAFQFVRANMQQGDAVLSPIPAAAYLHLGQPGYFIAQDAGHTFVQLNRQGILADRWAGAPWLRTADELKQILRNAPHVWLVLDTLTLDSQFHSDWKQVMRYNTPQVWAEDGVMVFRGAGLVEDIPTKPDIPLNIQLGDQVSLIGYSREILPAQLRLSLFWQVLARLPVDYTTFVHIRNQAGATVAQVDVQPLAGEYPTSRWRAGETVTDRITLPLPPNLPAGKYRLLVGLYRWDTLERLPVLHDLSGENAIELETIKVQ